jgi:uncharacterized membrane protein HdeD (DUF308 family)
MIPAAEIAGAARNHWWLFLLRGLLAITFGVLTLWWPGATLIVLMAFIAAYALVDGVVAILSAFRLRTSFDRWWVVLMHGLISAAFGVFAFIRPALSLWYIVLSVSLWMLVASIAQFLLARVQRLMGVQSVWAIVGGVVSLALAVVAVVFPPVTVAAVLALIAWFSLFAGIVQLVVAFTVRSIGRRIAPAAV